MMLKLIIIIALLVGWVAYLMDKMDDAIDDLNRRR